MDNKNLLPKVGLKRVFDVKFCHEIKAGGKKTRLWVPLPQTTSYQFFSREVKFEGNFTVAFISDVKTPTLYAEFECEKPVLDVNFEITTIERTSGNLDAKFDENEKLSSEISQFLRPSKFIPTDGAVKKLAEWITRGAKSDVERARAIFAWVARNARRDESAIGCGVGDAGALLNGLFEADKFDAGANLANECDKSANLHASGAGKFEGNELQKSINLTDERQVNLSKNNESALEKSVNLTNVCKATKQEKVVSEAVNLGNTSNVGASKFESDTFQESANLVNECSADKFANLNSLDEKGVGKFDNNALQKRINLTGECSADKFDDNTSQKSANLTSACKATKQEKVVSEAIKLGGADKISVGKFDPIKSANLNITNESQSPCGARNSEQKPMITGKCKDINTPFVALCRAAGVSAREISGIRIGGSRMAATYGKADEKGFMNVTATQHCRAEFYARGIGWVPCDPADVAKLRLAENLGDDDERLGLAAKFLFGGWEMHWIGFNDARDVLLVPRQEGAPLNSFAYPYCEADGVPLDFYDAKNFAYRYTSQEILG